MTDEANTGPAMPSLEDWQHWTLVMGRAQQMLMEFWAEQMKQGKAMPQCPIIRVGSWGNC